MNEEAKKFLEEYDQLCKKHGLALKPQFNLGLEIIKVEPEQPIIETP